MTALLLYRASAGSGKTYTLVTQYIKWSLHYPDAFKHILAVTFTNQATQEMKQRIMETLYSLTNGEETDFQKELCHMGWTRSALQARSQAILSRMVYQYGDFSVTTIDSFFHKIVQSFAKELGLKQHFTIEMEETVVLEDCIAMFLQSDHPLLQKWMIDFALKKLLAGQRWHVERYLQLLGKTLFQESFKLYEKELVTVLQQENALPYFIATLQAPMRSFEQRMQNIGKKAVAILQQAALTPEDFAYGTKGIIGYFLKIAHTKDFAPTKRALLGIASITNWIPKKTTQPSYLLQVINNGLQPLLVEAVEVYTREGLYYRTAEVVSRFVHSFGMIAALLEVLKQYRIQHNVLFISDIATLLYQVIQENDTPFLYERMGNQFHHFLIDEFQDLSLFQWMNIKSLLHNSLAQGYSSLLVGDVKQSIYRWRGSNWKFLHHQVETEFEACKVHRLTTNRRSQKTIVRFNSNFFRVAASRLMHYLEITLKSAKENMPLVHYELEQMKRVYADAGQQTIEAPIQKGYVELLFLKTNLVNALEQEAYSWQALAQKEIIRLVNHLQQKGIAAKDIAVLVRNNREAALVARLCDSLDHMPGFCMQWHHSIPFLGSHIAIKILIHVLYYLTNAQDLINTMALIQAYSSYIGHASIVWHHYLLQEKTGMLMQTLLPQAFWEQKDFLQNLPIYPCATLLIKILFGKDGSYKDVLSFFQSMLLDYSYRETEDSIQAFLNWWEKKGKLLQLPVSSSTDRLQVMTIHQAKGLEFNVVIIPFCSWHLDHMPQQGPLLWCVNHQKTPFDYFPVCPLSYGMALKDTYYAPDYYLEYMQIHLDNLNLLYVAFTRAKEQLYVMAPLPDQVVNMATTADLLYQVLVPQKIEGSMGTAIAEKLAADVQETAIGIKFCLGS